MYHDKATEEISMELLASLRDGDKEKALLLIRDPSFSSRANPNVIDHTTGRALLHYAVILDAIELAQWAIKRGASVLVTDNEGKTPLDLSPSHNMKFLLDQVPTQDLHGGEVGQSPSFSGELLKWTNYANGWKSRWFELERGVLSYFKHRDDAENACRGAINLRIAEINYNKKNPKQFDVKGKGFKRCRVKAKNEKIARDWVYQLNLSKQWAEDQPESLANGLPDPSSTLGVTSHRESTYQSRMSVDRFSSDQMGATSDPHTNNAAATPSTSSANPFVGSHRPTSPSPSGASAQSTMSNHPLLESLQVASNNLKNQLCLQSFLIKSLIGELKKVQSTSHAAQESIAEYEETAAKSSSDIFQQLEDLEKLTSTNQRDWQVRLRSEQERIDFLADILQIQEIESQSKMDTLSKRRKSTIPRRSIKTSAATEDEEAASTPDNNTDKSSADIPSTSTADHTQVPASPEERESDDDEESDSSSDEFADANDQFFDTATSLLQRPSDTHLGTAAGSRTTLLKQGPLPSDSEESVSAKDPILLDGYPYPPKLRLAFPESGNKKPNLNLWQMIKSAIGKDLTKISVPVFFNEPTSFLQRFTEDMEYSSLLDIASRLSHSADRTLYVAAFAMSNYSSTFGRVAKPFNPLLGETYEYVRTDKRYRAISEQVCHHPPVSACWVEGRQLYIPC